MNIETDFKAWLEGKDTRYLNDLNTGAIFNDFIKQFIITHYSEISLIINNVERSRAGKPIR